MLNYPNGFVQNPNVISSRRSWNRCDREQYSKCRYHLSPGLWKIRTREIWRISYENLWPF